MHQMDIVQRPAVGDVIEVLRAYHGPEPAAPHET